ncbi:MAG TPA: hypothetical protein VMI13_07105 [Solirubrobacteraceae bacterium]|nr:hypothetical protein [Solirubrobacteraceae bacterium]
MRVLIIAVILVVLAGCGSSGHVPTVRNAPAGVTVPTHAAFVAKADAICAHLFAQEAPLKARFGALESSSSTVAEAERVSILEHVVALARAGDKQFVAVPVAPEDSARVAKLVTGFSEEATDLHNVAIAFANHERAAAEGAVTTLSKVQAQDKGLALGLGLHKCSS